MSIRESSAKACVWLREASKMLSIRTIGNGWTGNSRSENMNCQGIKFLLSLPVYIILYSVMRFTYFVYTLL